MAEVYRGEYRGSRQPPRPGRAVGFDHRIDRHFIAGLTASVTHALWGPAWDAVEGGLHKSYYFYPRWL